MESIWVGILNEVIFFVMNNGFNGSVEIEVNSIR